MPSMNDLIRGRAPDEPEADDVVSLATLRDYAAVMGCTIAEARAALSSQPAPVNPPGHAGAGTGSPPPSSPDMNAAIRRMSGRG